jgi:hypothetical protein
MISLPALLTRMFMFRSVRSRCWAHWRIDASEDRSRDTTTTWPTPSTSLVSSRMSSAACSAFFSSRQAMMTRAPAVGNGTRKCREGLGSCSLSRFYSISTCELCDLPSLTDRLQVVLFFTNLVKRQETEKKSVKLIRTGDASSFTKIRADTSISQLRVTRFLLLSKNYDIIWYDTFVNYNWVATRWQ